MARLDGDGPRRSGRVPVARRMREEPRGGVFRDPIGWTQCRSGRARAHRVGRSFFALACRPPRHRGRPRAGGHMTDDEVEMNVAALDSPSIPGSDAAIEPNLTGVHILIVEDDPDGNELVCAILE